MSAFNPIPDTPDAFNAFVALGSNLGDSAALLDEAMRRLGAFSGQPLLKSSLWQSSPVDCPPGSPLFVNAVAGLAAFYLLPSWPAPVRALLVAAGFAAAIYVGSLTAAGHRGREFASEAMFELRKVVWPTRPEATRITLVVLVVVVIISLILSGFDFVISQLIKLLLSN